MEKGERGDVGGRRGGGGSSVQRTVEGKGGFKVGELRHLAVTYNPFKVSIHEAVCDVTYPYV